jgi:hypothetical protein
VLVRTGGRLGLCSYDRMYALGVSQFGQMTAGSYCYIGPQARPSMFLAPPRPPLFPRAHASAAMPALQ